MATHDWSETRLVHDRAELDDCVADEATALVHCVGAGFHLGGRPRWEDFPALRERRDPNNIFLTSYRRDRFGLWDAPAPVPQP